MSRVQSFFHLGLCLLALLQIGMSSGTECRREGLTWGPAATSTVQLHVSPTGSDSNDGSAAHPLRTLERARDLLRGLTVKAGGATVWLRSGVHPRNATFELTEEDSGSPDAPIEYRAWPGECISVQSAQSVPPQTFQDLTAAERTRIHPGVNASRIKSLDLKKVGIEVPAWQPLWGAPGLLSVVIDGVRQNMSQYPNNGWMEPKSVWATGVRPNETNPIFEYKTDSSTLTKPDRHLGRESVWAKAGGVVDTGLWFAGYWRVAWGYEGIKVKSINTTSHRIELEKTPVGGLGDKYSCHLDEPGQVPVPCSYAPNEKDMGRVIYKAFNLLEEIDTPGEWSIDFTSQKLYLYFTEDPETAPVVQLLSNPATLVSLNNVSHVRLSALGFEKSRGTALSIEGGTGVEVAGCVFSLLDQDAVLIHNGLRHKFISNNLHSIGQTGVTVIGGTVDNPLNHLISNNHIHDFAQLVKVYESAMNIGFKDAENFVVGVNVTHNRVHSSPHMGIQFGGFYNHFELNDVSQWSQISNDIGCFYSFSQRKYIHGNVFRNNYCHDGNAGDGLYFDFDQDFDLLEGNLVTNANRAYLHKCSEGNSSVLLKGNLAINVGGGLTILSAGNESIIESNAVAGYTDYAFDVNGFFNVSENVGFKNVSEVEWNTTALLPGLVIADTSPLLAQFPDLKPFPLDDVGLVVDDFRTAQDLCICLETACECKTGLVRVPGTTGLETKCQKAPEHEFL